MTPEHKARKRRRPIRLWVCDECRAVLSDEGDDQLSGHMHQGLAGRDLHFSRLMPATAAFPKFANN